MVEFVQRAGTSSLIQIVIMIWNDLFLLIMAVSMLLGMRSDRSHDSEDRVNVEYDIECDDFLIPALSVQPLVENAVRHGIGTYEKGGTVWIKSRRLDGKIIIEVIDDGSGKSNITPQQESRKGIGIDNVRKRLQSQNLGELEIITGDHGTTARIIIKDIGEKE